MTIRILLADDHTILRQALAPLLESEKDLHIIGEACTGRETLQQVERLRPDVVLLDLNMPDLNGLEVIRQLEAVYPRPAIVILTMLDKTAFVLEALKHGNASFVMKGESSVRLVEAIHMAVRGERYLSPMIEPDDIDRYVERTKSQEIDLWDTLTNREREIIILVIEGLSNHEIATRLMISRRTVEKHRENAMDKLRMQSQNELIRYAVNRGIIPVDKDF
jgi:DNA-binding NarL/FixJ family response regulator